MFVILKPSQVESSIEDSFRGRSLPLAPLSLAEPSFGDFLPGILILSFCFLNQVPQLIRISFDCNLLNGPFAIFSKEEILEKEIPKEEIQKERISKEEIPKEGRFKVSRITRLFSRAPFE